MFRRRIRKPLSVRGVTRAPEDVGAAVAACTSDVEREFAGTNFDPREVRREIILRLRYTYHLTWEQIGEGLGMTGERARQVTRDVLRGRAANDFAEAFRVTGSPPDSSRPSADQKRQIVTAFYDLMVAVATGSSAIAECYNAFRDVYRGESRTFVDAFHSCRTDADRDRWVTQLLEYLRQEIEPVYWRPQHS